MTKQLGAAIVNRGSIAQSQLDIVPPPEQPVSPSVEVSISGRLSKKSTARIPSLEHSAAV